MSTIGGTSTTSTTGVSGATPAAPPTTSMAVIALRDPRLAAQAAALLLVASGGATLAFGATGPDVQAIQEVLRAVGYTATPRSGLIDRPTQQQIALFQRQNGLTASGDIDQATLAKLDEVAMRAAAGGTGGAGPVTPGRPVIPTAPATATTTVDPLDGKLYMDATTFATMPPYQWARDSVELESVMGVNGVEPGALLDALRATNNAGRTTYQRMRRPEFADAFTLGYDDGGVDDMKWDGDSHALRERLRYVSLTVEDGRYEPDQRTGVREVSVGTDIMDDTYYDTADYALLKNDLSVRGRARWDSPTEIRRILIGVKANTVVDEFGIKRTDKTDVRNDGASAEDIAGLDAAVRTGKTSWDGDPEAVKPLKGVYDALRAKGALPDIGAHEDVLMLEPKVHVRSVRSRYHMNETELEKIQALHVNGEARINGALALAARAKAAGNLTAQELAAVETLERAGREALALGKMPDRGFRSAPATHDELEKDRVLAEGLDAKYHEFARALDGARRVLADAREQTYERHARMFVSWQKATDGALANKGAYDPFVAKYDALAAAGPQAFNDYGQAQRAAGNDDFRSFAPLDAAGWAALKNALVNEQLRVHQRQIEAAGSAAQNLWFEEARAFYVPDSSRNTSNFLIDTFDMSEYIKHEDWESIPPAQRTAGSVIPKDKIFHVSLVAESQVELGLEKPYLDRLKALQGEINGDRASLAMKWMTASARPGIDPANVASYGMALATLAQLPDAQLDAEVAKLNEFARQQGSALRPLTAADLRRLDPALLTLENRDRAVRTDGAVERNFDGARFVFDRYMDAQKFISEVKGDRTLRMLRNAGAPRSATWETTTASKGETALRILAGPNP